ncbi:hypothetical protein V2J09_007440 [Rumex salicifolius]
MAAQTRARKRLETKETTTEMAPQPGGAGNEKGRKRKTTKETTTTMTPQTRGRGKEKGRKRQKTKKTTTAMAPQTRGGGGKGKAKTTKKTTTAFRNARDWTTDEEEQLSEMTVFQQAELRQTPTIVLHSASWLQNIFTWFFRKKNCDGFYKHIEKRIKNRIQKSIEVAHRLLGRNGYACRKNVRTCYKGGLNPTVKEQISDEIGKHIAWRLDEAAKIFNTLFFVLEWDSEVLKLIIEVIEDLKKDLLLPVPELEEISSSASDVLKADEKWKDVMANGVKDHMRMWLINTVDVDEIMEKWAKNPTRKIESGFTHGRKFSEFCKATSG